jgi:hypothetical protein
VTTDCGGVVRIQRIYDGGGDPSAESDKTLVSISTRQ